ncbi:hypothetical protein VB636_00835, partial [Paracoccus sp. APAP_BH8]|uniref:hypothetical protein n=1 Tax=Paracoccus sp. APAP_BH8 TaxID=3110237 RepID=UPI002FD87440
MAVAGPHGILGSCRGLLFRRLPEALAAAPAQGVGQRRETLHQRALDRLSGTWYIREVTTEMVEGALVQRFSALSNALGRRGGESFGPCGQAPRPSRRSGSPRRAPA